MSPSAPPAPLSTLFLDDLRQSAKPGDWLWHGYVAPGSMTLLTSQWKAGKTTLVAALLHHMKAGGELAGLAVRPGRAVVVSEEGAEHWLRRSEKFDFGTHVCWVCRPFPGKPTEEDWHRLLDHLLSLRRERGIDLAVIDPLANFLPGRDENLAGTMLSSLLPLKRLMGEGMAVLVLHHPRKRGVGGGQSARGSGALSGYADILIEMDWFGHPSQADRRRVLRAWSRCEETPRERVIELNEAGTEYRVCGDLVAVEESDGQRLLRALLEKAPPDGWTIEEIRQYWPVDAGSGDRRTTVPSRATLWRWLEVAGKEGRVARSGTGRKASPFRYEPAGRRKEREAECGWLEELPPLPPLEPLEGFEVIKKAKKAMDRRMKQREEELRER